MTAQQYCLTILHQFKRDDMKYSLLGVEYVDVYQMRMLIHYKNKKKRYLDENDLVLKNWCADCRVYVILPFVYTKVQFCLLADNFKRIGEYYIPCPFVLSDKLTVNDFLDIVKRRVYKNDEMYVIVGKSLDKVCDNSESIKILEDGITPIEANPLVFIVNKSRSILSYIF